MEKSFGLLAISGNGDWDLQIDEDLSSGEYFFSIDSSSIYLNFKIKSLDIIKEIAEYLKNPSKEAEHIEIGKFANNVPINLIWDNESIGKRCFVFVDDSKKTSSVLRFSITCEAIQKFITSLEDLANNLEE